MAYLGRKQLGGTATLMLQCRNASFAPSLPDAPPCWKVFSGTTLVATGQMPIQDRFTVTGLFRLPLFLNRLYAAGFYQVVYYYNVSGFYGVEHDVFQIVPGGDLRGAVTAAYFYERPEANYIVQSLGESGSIIKGRNPTV